MTINQLFKNKIPYDLFINFLLIFDINESNISNSIIIKEKINDTIINKFLDLKQDIITYYIDCKHSYFESINSAKLITILKQILKLYDYKLESYEKYINQKRMKLYKIIDINKKINISNIILFN